MSDKTADAGAMPDEPKPFDVMPGITEKAVWHNDYIALRTAATAQIAALKKKLENLSECERCDKDMLETVTDGQFRNCVCVACHNKALAQIAALKADHPTEDMILAGMEKSVLRRPSVDDESYVVGIYKAMRDAARGGEPKDVSK